MRSRIQVLVSIAFVVCVFTGCGSGIVGPDNAGKTKAALEKIFALIKEDKLAEAAPLIVYRGEDAARNWKDVCDYAKEEDKKRVDQMAKRVKRMLDAGPPVFVKYSEEKESEGTWQVWDVTFGEGKGAWKGGMACLLIKGQVALGDIDAAVTVK